MHIEIESNEGTFVVTTRCPGAPDHRVEVNDYQIACAFAQGIAAGVAMIGPGEKVARISYPRPCSATGVRPGKGTH